MFRAPSFAGAPVVFFTAPAGFVTVVKQISIVIGATVLEASAWVQDDEGGRLVWAHAADTPLTSPQSWQFEGPWTLLPGETLAPATDGITVADFYASGFLLST